MRPDEKALLKKLSCKRHRFEKLSSVEEEQFKKLYKELLNEAFEELGVKDDDLVVFDPIDKALGLSGSFNIYILDKKKMEKLKKSGDMKMKSKYEDRSFEEPLEECRRRGLLDHNDKYIPPQKDRSRTEHFLKCNNLSLDQALALLDLSMEDDRVRDKISKFM